MSVSTRHAMVTRRGIIDGERGSIILLTAIMLVVLLGVTAFAVDASFMYMERNRLHAAADAGAKSAAFAWSRWRSSANLDVWVDKAIADTNLGYTPSKSVLHCDDASAHCAAAYRTADFIEVVIDKEADTFFGRIFGVPFMRPRARAVAGILNGQDCLIALGNVSVGTATINMPLCDVSAGGTIEGTALGAGITARSIGAQSCLAGCGGFTVLHLPAPPPYPIPADPLVNLSTPSVNGPCTSPGTVTGNWLAGCYAVVTLSGAVTMTGGLSDEYFIAGQLIILPGTTITGTNRLLYLHSAATVTVAANVNLTLSAPTTGTFEGIAFYQNRGNANAINFPPTSGVNITGAFYAPGAAVTLGHLGGGGCSVMVVGSLTVSGGSNSLSNACSGYVNGSPLKTTAMAE